MTAGRRATRRPRVEELESRLVLSVGRVPNWAGYTVATKPGAVTAVHGTWVVRPVSGSGNAISSFWVGIDGASSPTVEQTGTDSILVNGRPQYDAWYEMYPKPVVIVPGLKVRPGNKITAEVSVPRPGQFRLQLTNTTTGKSFTTTQAAPAAQRSSAEWIVESQSRFFSFVPLANFGAVTFSGATVTLGKTTTAIDQSSGQASRLNMGSFRWLEATTSALTDSGGRQHRKRQPPASSFRVIDLAPSVPNPGPAFL
jgi:hypothetical protein